MKPAVCLAVVALVFSLAGADLRAKPARTSDAPQASIVLGKEFLQKSVFLSDAALGVVTDMIRNPTHEATFGAAGLKGAVFLKADLSVASRVTFAPASRPGLFGFFNAPLFPTHVQFVDVDGHGNWAFLNRGGVGWSDASFIGGDGKPRWTYGGSPGLDDLAAGDLDGDGAVDFVAGFNGGGGIRRIDRNGKQIWRKPGANVWHVEIVDTEGDGKRRIVHSNAGGDLTIRDPDGSVIRSVKPDVYCSAFSLCRWPNSKSSAKVLVLDEDQICLVDFIGGMAGQYSIPRGSRYRRAFGSMVRLKTDQQEFFAVVLAGELKSPSTLFVFNAERQLVYHETITGECSSILALPRGGSATVDDLLVGGTDTIWKYSAAQMNGQKAGAK